MEEHSCPACGRPCPASRVCHECVYAYALAPAVHPRPAPARGDRVEPGPGDDIDLWDAYALLGDVGGGSQPLPGG